MDVRCLLSVWRVLACCCCTCRLEAGCAICPRHGEASRSGIAGPRMSEGSLGFPLAQLEGEAKSIMSGAVSNPSSPPEGTSLQVRSCHRALLQSGGGVCKKRGMGGMCGRGLSLPRAALCRQPGRSGERRLAEASGQAGKQPRAGAFYGHLLRAVLFTGEVWG